MQDVIAFVDEHRKRFVDDLTLWAAIPSISSDPARAADVKKSAEHLAAHLRSLGAGRVETWATAGHPAVFAEWLVAPGKPSRGVAQNPSKQRHVLAELAVDHVRPRPPERVRRRARESLQRGDGFTDVLDEGCALPQAHSQHDVESREICRDL